MLWGNEVKIESTEGQGKVSKYEWKRLFGAARQQVRERDEGIKRQDRSTL